MLSTLLYLPAEVPVETARWRHLFISASPAQLPRSLVTPFLTNTPSCGAAAGAERAGGTRVRDVVLGRGICFDLRRPLAAATLTELYGPVDVLSRERFRLVPGSGKPRRRVARELGIDVLVVAPRDPVVEVPSCPRK